MLPRLPQKLSQTQIVPYQAFNRELAQRHDLQNNMHKLKLLQKFLQNDQEENSSVLIPKLPSKPNKSVRNATHEKKSRQSCMERSKPSIVRQAIHHLETEESERLRKRRRNDENEEKFKLSQLLTHNEKIKTNRIILNCSININRKLNSHRIL